MPASADWAEKLFAKYSNMSRIGKKLIQLPTGVTIQVNDGVLVAKGPKGELTQELSSQVIVETESTDKGDAAQVTVKDNDQDSAIWGTTRALIANMVHGVSEGWQKILELNGVGFKMEVKGSMVVMRLGFSHAIEYQLADGIEAKIEGNTLIIDGINKQVVGQTASEIRSLKKPEPYKGKGFKYKEEILRRKAGKSAKGEK